MNDNGFSYNKYDNNAQIKEARETAKDIKKTYIYFFVIGIVFTFIFLIFCFLGSIFDNDSVSTSSDECRNICNGSFSISNGKCVCSDY